MYSFVLLLNRLEADVDVGRLEPIFKFLDLKFEQLEDLLLLGPFEVLLLVVATLVAELRVSLLELIHGHGDLGYVVGRHQLLGKLGFALEDSHEELIQRVYLLAEVIIEG